MPILLYETMKHASSAKTLSFTGDVLKFRRNDACWSNHVENIPPLFSTGAEFESSETDAVIVILEDFSVSLVRLLHKLL